MLGFISAILMAGSTSVMSEADPELVALRVRVYADRHVDTATVRPALEGAAHGARDSAGTVIVSVPCVAGVAFRLTRRAGTGTNPLLAMPRHDDLVGAIVAHEIGHLLGIRHAPSGLMRASLEADDMIALRRGKLRFSPAEARGLRIAALLAGEDRLRSSTAGPRPNP